MEKFLIGFAVGAAIGVAAVLLTNPRRTEEAREGLGELLQNAIEAGRQASSSRAQLMWSEYRQRVATPPPAANHRPLFDGA
jgi:gas vesicle protein